MHLNRNHHDAHISLPGADVSPAALRLHAAATRPCRISQDEMTEWVAEFHESGMLLIFLCNIAAVRRILSQTLIIWNTGRLDPY